ncbi:unnamed protein product [Thlaspi arvense]|uniref:RRM domain-containing protein n=1 Tax=Thlaspi arvense TaxID=13288 RepID=A0AAU9SJU4_THLAR|nr:unnamed protein product [Thlaspi arvense]
MASSSKESAAKANILGKRKQEDDSETKPILILKKLKELSEEKETTIEQIEGSVELLETNIDFFKDVGQVVRVRLMLSRRSKPVGHAFVEFVSANEAKKALETKNGQYLHDRKIILDVANKANNGAPYLPPNTDFFGDVAEVVSVRLIANREGKHLGYGFVEFASADEAKRALEKMNGEYLHDHKILLMKGLGKAPGFAEAVAAREKTLFAAHLSSEAEISDIINFFKDAGEVVHVRLLVSHKGKRVGYGFVEFASFNEANKALEKKNGEYLHDRKIILGAVSTASCHPPNIGFFKGVGEVVGVRLIVDHRGESVGCGFVEFASANEAKKALQEKKDSKIILNVAEIAPYPFRLK